MDGFRSDGGYSEFVLQVNRPPHLRQGALESGCEITPKKGPSMEKVFTMYCVGFVDPDNDLPLTYKFYFDLNGENYQLDATALPQVSDAFSLPFGVSRVSAIVADIYGGESMRYNVSVEVGMFFFYLL